MSRRFNCKLAVFLLQFKAKNRISRRLTDPGKDDRAQSDTIRTARSLGNLVDNGEGGLLGTKVVSLSLGHEIDSEEPPPPLPPRRGSSQASQARQGMWKENLCTQVATTLLTSCNRFVINKPILGCVGMA